MIDKAHSPSPETLPFIFRFAKPIPPNQSDILRYDRERQKVQIWENGAWIDGLHAQRKYGDTTFMTIIGGETSDDV